MDIDLHTFIDFNVNQIFDPFSFAIFCFFGGYEDKFKLQIRVNNNFVHIEILSKRKIGKLGMSDNFKYS